MINTERLYQRMGEITLARNEYIVGRRRRRPRPKPKPTPTGPLSLWLYLSSGEIEKIDCKSVGVDNIITHAITPMSRDNKIVFWGNSTAELIKSQAAWLVEQARGVPVYVFFFCFGKDLETEVPWKANDQVKEHFHRNLKVWASTDVSGLIMDCEDETPLARRNKTTGVIERAWWPDGSYADQFAALIKDAMGTKPFYTYGIEYLQLSPYGYNGNLRPPTIPATGWFRFMRNLPAKTRHFSGGTYQSNDRESIVGVRERFNGSGKLEFGNPLFTPGLWLDTAGEDLGLLTGARSEGGHAWIYQDRGFLLNNPSELNRLKQVIA